MLSPPFSTHLLILAASSCPHVWLLPCPGSVSSGAEKGSLPCPQLTGRILPHFPAFQAIKVNPPPATLLHTHPPQAWLHPPVPAQEQDLLPPSHARCRAQGVPAAFYSSRDQLVVIPHHFPPKKPTLSAMSCFCIPDIDARWRSASFQAIKIDPCGPLSSQVAPWRRSRSFASRICRDAVPGDEAGCIPPSNPFVQRRRTTERTLPQTARRDERLTRGQEPAQEIQGRKIH